jgi:hypothetical protein
MPEAARVREPVVPGPASTSVSEVIATVTVPALVSLTNVIVQPMATGTLALLAMVNVRAVVSAEG